MTLDDLLKLADSPRRVEPVPIGDRTAYVRGLSFADVEAAADAAEKAGDPDSRPHLLARAICDERGVPLCGDADAYVARLKGMPAVVTRRLFAAMDAASDVPVGALEAAAKNLEARTDGGSTGSAASSEASGGSSPRNG